MAGDRLDRYRQLRDFARTSEPPGPKAVEGGEQAPEAGVRPPEQGGRFIVQEHHATSLHWDLRLERDGALASWAVPKGIPPHPRQDHLAVRTEDHPLEYLEFSGDIPAGSYGAGRMGIWDRGTYTSDKWDEREVLVTFHGERTSGRYALFRTRGRNWMIHRMDPPLDPGRELLPRGLRPMQPVPGPMPDHQEAWAFQAAWSELRVAAACQGGRVALTAADGADVTSRFPELRALGEAMGTTEVVLDGEVVVAGADGRPDQDRLARRAGALTEAAARRLAGSSAAVLMLGDVVWLDGRSCAALPYTERRRRLEDLDLAGPSWQVNPDHRGEGAALLAAASAQGLPGIVGKRMDGPYRPGEASPDWVFIAS
ncbi:MAG TPA: DNA polymerase ligase N-terminal domain-containing protein [Acidimicrobiales bacterium]|nr:DNA polymerase ligase N-terminal domain-containing protein [Acidimicrobiales bacterium]